MFYEVPGAVPGWFIIRVNGGNRGYNCSFEAVPEYLRYILHRGGEGSSIFVMMHCFVMILLRPRRQQDKACFLKLQNKMYTLRLNSTTRAFFYFSNGCCCPKRSYLYLFIYFFLKFDEWVKRGKVNKILRKNISVSWVEMVFEQEYLERVSEKLIRENLFTQRNKSEYPPSLNISLRVLHLFQFVQAKINKI